MNPLTNVKNITKLNEIELSRGLTNKSSWHNIYKESAWIFVGGLSYGLTEGDILTVFSQYGEIVNLNMVRDKKTGKTKGFCFLCYSNQKSTVLAVDNFNGIKLCGRTLRVDHVENYKPPKENEDDDEITKTLQTQGCAPKPIKTEPEDDIPNPKPALKVHKREKDKKKKKHKKHIRKSSSDSSSSSEENIVITTEKHDLEYERYSSKKSESVKDKRKLSKKSKKRHKQSSTEEEEEPSRESSEKSEGDTRKRQGSEYEGQKVEKLSNIADRSMNNSRRGTSGVDGDRCSRDSNNDDSRYSRDPNNDDSRYPRNSNDDNRYSRDSNNDIRYSRNSNNDGSRCSRDSKIEDSRYSRDSNQKEDGRYSRNYNENNEKDSRNSRRKHTPSPMYNRADSPENSDNLHKRRKH